QGGARPALLRHVRARGLPLHEADHPAQAPRQPARPASPGDGARRRRIAGPARDRTHGGDQLTDGETLVLVPTALEAEALRTEWPLEICGFGLAAAGVGAMAAIARHRPATVVLVGLAGTYDAEWAPLEGVVVPGSVRCVGIGAGGRSATDLGFAAS